MDVTAMEYAMLLAGVAGSCWRHVPSVPVVVDSFVLPIVVVTVEPAVSNPQIMVAGLSRCRTMCEPSVLEICAAGVRRTRAR